MKPDLLRGHLDLLVLEVLARGPGHGYAIISELRDRSDGVLDLKEGSLYPALHRLEDVGLLASEWQPVAGRRRRIYRITPAGRKALTAERAGWRSLVAAVEAVLRTAAPAGGAA